MNDHDVCPSTEIGGYFGLSLPDHGDPFPDTHKFQSGRAALRAALQCAGIRHVFLPTYICDAAVQAVVDAGSTSEHYVLDESLYPKKLPQPLPEKSAVLYVNYFGLCNKNIELLSQEIPGKQLIIDNCQALFAVAEKEQITIYSPRKFIGVPDGGLLVATGINIEHPECEDEDSLSRMNALLLRMAYSARAGYSSYVESEKSLNNTSPLKMSRLTNRLASSIDMNIVRRKRRGNFLALAEQLDGFNQHKWVIDSSTVPLCYPLLIDRNIDGLKKQLIDEGIFIPTYWPEIKSRVVLNSMEYRLSHCCLFVPCDQRYSISQINILAETISDGLKRMGDEL